MAFSIGKTGNRWPTTDNIDGHTQVLSAESSSALKHISQNKIFRYSLFDGEGSIVYTLVTF